MLKSYLSITKPGIIFGNLISVAAGFFLAAKSEPANFLLLLTTLVGVGLVIASGCVVNNIFDRDIDQKMKRTQNRELVMGNINIDAAFVYALVLLLNGTALLFQLVNLLTNDNTEHDELPSLPKLCSMLPIRHPMLPIKEIEAWKVITRLSCLETEIKS